jgi:hypothetical protein
MAIIRGYTIYLYSKKSNSCLLYFAVDGTSKAKALKFGKAIAKLWEDYYADLPWKAKIRVEVEIYIPKS